MLPDVGQQEALITYEGSHPHRKCLNKYGMQTIDDTGSSNEQTVKQLANLSEGNRDVHPTIPSTCL